MLLADLPLYRDQCRRKDKRIRIIVFSLHLYMHFIVGRNIPLLCFQRAYSGHHYIVHYCRVASAEGPATKRKKK